jgi:hypothetical protein
MHSKFRIDWETREKLKCYSFFSYCHIPPHDLSYQHFNGRNIIGKVMSFECTIAYPHDACPICTDLLTDDVWDHGEKKHLFHGRCIAEWVDKVPDCPICRAAVDKTSLLGYGTLLAEEDEDEFLFDFPKEWNGIYLLVMMSGASVLVYDFMSNGNPAVIGVITSLGAALIVREIS